MKKIMILGASDLQLPAILEAKNMGLEVISIDFNPEAVGFKYCDKKYVVSTLDTERILEIAKLEKISGIMTLASDLPMKTVAIVAEELNLPGPSVKTSEIVTNKYLMRDCFKKNKLQSIDYAIIAEFDELLEFVKRSNKKLIMKPISNSGSRGINYIDGTESSEQLREKFEYCCSFSNSNQIVVEEYLYGNEISVETITIKGKTSIIQITDKITTKQPYFVEMGHSQPAKLTKNSYEKIKKLTKDVIKAVELENGPAHIEMMINSKEVNIVEIGARLGGDFITTALVPFSTGIDMVNLVLKIAVDEKIEIKKSTSQASSIKFFNFKPGKIKSISGLDILEKNKQIEFFKLDLKNNDEIPEIKNSLSRYGFVIAKANSRLDAEKKCIDAINSISIEYY